MLVCWFCYFRLNVERKKHKNLFISLIFCHAKCSSIRFSTIRAALPIQCVFRIHIFSSYFYFGVSFSISFFRSFTKGIQFLVLAVERVCHPSHDHALSAEEKTGERIRISTIHINFQFFFPFEIFIVLVWYCRAPLQLGRIYMCIHL